MAELVAPERKPESMRGREAAERVVIREAQAALVPLAALEAAAVEVAEAAQPQAEQAAQAAQDICL